MMTRTLSPTFALAESNLSAKPPMLVHLRNLERSQPELHGRYATVREMVVVAVESCMTAQAILAEVSVLLPPWRLSGGYPRTT